MMSVDEIEKVDKASVGEKVQTQETSTTPPQFTMIPTTLLIVVYQRKETTTSTISTLVQNTPVSRHEKVKENKGETFREQKVDIVENEGTQAQTGQDDTPTPIAQVQGATKKVEPVKDRIEEIDLTKKLEEQLAIQTLVTLPGTATPPIQALHRPSIEAIPLQSSRPSPRTSKVDEVTSFVDVNLDEVIQLPKFDFATITIEQMRILQDPLAKKKKHELLRQEHRQKQALLDIKEIFLDVFSLLALEANKSIIEQLTNLVEKVNDADLDSNVKLPEWFEIKFQNKVNENISSSIALSQVELATKIDHVKKVLENIFSLYTNLCNPTLFTQEIRSHILSLESHMQSCSITLPMSLAQSEKHLRNLLKSQSELAILHANEVNIKAKLINIQTMLTPHMEILQKELAFAKTLMKKDLYLSTHEGLVHLVSELAIHIKSLEVTCDNWDVALKIMLQIHKTFLDKHTISV